MTVFLLSWCSHSNTYAYVCVCVYVSICLPPWLYLCACECVLLYPCPCACMCVLMHGCTHTFILRPCISAYLCMHMCVNVCVSVCACACMSMYQMCNRWGVAGDHAGMHAQSAMWERIDQWEQLGHRGLRQPVCHHLLCQLLHALCLSGEYSDKKNKRSFDIF